MFEISQADSDLKECRAFRLRRHCFRRESSGGRAAEPELRVETQAPASRTFAAAIPTRKFVQSGLRIMQRATECLGLAWCEGRRVGQACQLLWQCRHGDSGSEPDSAVQGLQAGPVSTARVVVPHALILILSLV